MDNEFVTLSFGDSVSSTTYVQEAGDAYPFNDGQWYKIVVTYDADTGSVLVYANSVETGMINSYTGTLPPL